MKTKVDLKRKAYLYPSPVLIIGTMFREKPNWSTVAYHGILDAQTILLTIESSHLTTQAIRANRCFSVNLPSAADAAAADFVGTRSGADYDKSGVFAYTMANALTPIADACALSYLCQVENLYEKNGKTYIIAKVQEIFAEEAIRREGPAIDLAGLDPLLFDWTGYYRLGAYVGKPFSKPGDPQSGQNA